MCVYSVAQLRPTLCDPIACVRQAPLSMGFLRQEYCRRLPFPPPRDLPDPGIEPSSPAMQVDSLPLSHQGSLQSMNMESHMRKTKGEGEGGSGEGEMAAFSFSFLVHHSVEDVCNHLNEWSDIWIGVKEMYLELGRHFKTPKSKVCLVWFSTTTQNSQKEFISRRKRWHFISGGPSTWMCTIHEPHSLPYKVNTVDIY